MAGGAVPPRHPFLGREGEAVRERTDRESIVVRDPDRSIDRPTTDYFVPSSIHLIVCQKGSFVVSPAFNPR